MKLPLSHIAKLFIPLAFIMTVMAGLVYLTVQQNFRMNANDPQIQIAEDLATQLSAGAPVNPNSLTASIDISKSLSTFVLIYDDAGKIITGSGKLNGQFPTMPAGVLDYTRTVGEDRLSWQPQTDVRVALVVIKYNGPNPGFVAVGRSLREVEQREAMLGWQVLAGWLAGIVGLFVLLTGREIMFSKFSRQENIPSDLNDYH